MSMCHVNSGDFLTAGAIAPDFGLERGHLMTTEVWQEYPIYPPSFGPLTSHILVAL